MSTAASYYRGLREYNSELLSRTVVSTAASYYRGLRGYSSELLSRTVASTATGEDDPIVTDVFNQVSHCYSN